MNQVSNKLLNLGFDKARKDINCVRTINKALKKYILLIDKEELSQIRDIALWKTFKNYKNRCEFLTYLYYNVIWLCKSNIRYVKKTYKEKTNIDLKKYNKYYINSASNIELYELGLSKEDEYLINSKFLYNKSLKEISNEFNCSIDCIRTKLKRLFKKIKKTWCI